MMTCRKVRRAAALADARAMASQKEREEIFAHLNACASCARGFASQELLRAELRAMPRMAPPPELAMQLRVMASRHLQRERRSWFWRAKDRLALDFQDMMRPLAVPLAGGLASTIFLFAMLVPSLAVHIPFAHDVPIGLTTEATLKSAAPISFDTGEAVVDVTVDDQGRMLDYSIVSDRSREDNASFCQSIANYLLFTTFTPPTAFGQPVGGTIRLNFRSSYVNVRG